MDSPSTQLQRRVGALLNKRPIGWRRATGGHTPAERWIFTFEDGTSCFVKAGGTPTTAEALTAEYNFYSQVQAGYLPSLLGYDGGEQPLLVLEDLSDAHWPPPWTPAQVDSVLSGLDQLHAIPTRGLSFPEVQGSDLAGWPLVAEDAAPFLSLGLCSERWLRYALPLLVHAEEQAPLNGDQLLHLDVRSDNVCFDGERIVILDWNYACFGNADLDLAAWAPSLEAEGGLSCDSLLPDAPELASLVSGYFAARAGIERPGRERLQQVQLFQLKPALRWAVWALGLPPLDGPNVPPG